MRHLSHSAKALALGAVATLLSLSMSVPSAHAAGKTAITAALTGEPSSLDPIYDTQLPALNVFKNIFDQLTMLDATGKVVPGLAESWSADPALTTWTFKIRQGVVFHDGTPVSAKDVVFTYQSAMKDPKSRLGGYMRTIESLSATGDYEVTFKLKTPFAPFDRQVTLVSILPAETYTKLGAAGFAKAPVGSGPYSLVSWNGTDTINLKRFDKYWGAKGQFETVTMQSVPDETTRANSVQSGDLDIALLGPSNVSAIKGSGTAEVVDQPSNRVLYVSFNGMANKWLGDVKFRKGVDLALDRKAISDDLLNGSVSPTGQLVAPVSFGYSADIPATETNLEEAKKLIAESGYDGSPIILSYPTTGFPQIDQMAQAIGFFLEEAGIKVSLDGQEQNTYSNNWFGKKFEGIYIYAFAPSLLDADLPYSMLLKSGAQNYISDPKIDQLMVAQIGEADPAKRAQLIGDISKIVKENIYYAPLFTDTYTYGVSSGLGWKSRPDGMIIFN